MNATLPHAWRALTLATLAFAANFSVWTLYAVLAIDFQDKLDLTGTELGILLSAPILSGALLRFPLGILSEYQSARSLWLWQMALTIPALLLLPLIDSFQGFFWLGLWIGISGVFLLLAFVMSPIGLAVSSRAWHWVFLMPAMPVRPFH